MPFTPAPEEVFTITPPPCLSSKGISCCMHRNTPRRLIPTMRSHSPPVISAAAMIGCSTPALLKAKSRRPNASIVLYQRPWLLTRRDSAKARELIPWGEEDSRHGMCGEPARGLFGERASRARVGNEEREPEPTAPIAGCGSGRDEPDGSGPDRRDGPTNAARLGPSLKLIRARGLSGKGVKRT